MILAFVLLAIFLYLTKHIILPYIRYRSYRKYGDGKFYPFVGELVMVLESVKKHGNFDYHRHHLLDQNNEQKVFVTNVGNKVKLILVDPEIVKEYFMKTNLYVKDETFIGNIKRFVKDGIVTAEGKQWKTSRRIFSKAFHFDYLQNLSPSIEAVAADVFHKMIKDHQLEAVDTIDCMQQITGTVVILSFFGETLEEYRIQGMKVTQALSHVINSLGDQIFSFQYFLLGKKYYEIGLKKEHRDLIEFIKQVNEFISFHLKRKINEINEEIKLKGKTENKSIIAELITSGQIDEISREQLYQDFATFYLAGMDTTGHLLGMTIYYITQNKEIYQTLQQEIDNNKDNSPQTLAQLPYMNAVIKETLRYYGPANLIFDRIATEDHMLGEMPIKKGTIVVPYAICIHRNTKYYDNPHVYNPSRWINKKDTDIPAYTFLPFSAGPRNCIGQHLAQLESRIILSLFVKTFEFSSPVDYKLIIESKFLCQPVDPLRIKLIPRK